MKRKSVINKFFYSLFALILSAAFFTGCGEGGDSGGSGTDIDVVFQSAAQIGGSSGTVDSTGLTLTFDVDPATLTADNITVTGATKGGLSGTGTTRSLAISNITVANGATVSVTITSPAGYSMSGSPQTAVVYRALYIGMSYQGGVIACILQSGDPGYDSNVPHGLIAAASDMDINGTQTFQWGGYMADLDGTGYTTGTAIGTGKNNTDTIVNFFDTIYQSSNSSTTYYTYDWVSLTTGTENFTDGTNTYAMSYLNNGVVAAKLCNDYTNTDTGTGVYSDWYLPSKDELDKLYLNKAGVGGFANLGYWSSSECGADGAWLQDFYDGLQGYSLKYDYGRVRAVRAF